GFAITIEAPDSVDVVAKTFGSGLTAAGWETTVETSPEGTMVIGMKQDGSRAQALVHDGENGAKGAGIDLIVARPEGPRGRARGRRAASSRPPCSRGRRDRRRRRARRALPAGAPRGCARGRRGSPHRSRAGSRRVATTAPGRRAGRR